ncbi:hypothetical protein [Nonomuraea sp. NPDC049784]|uniref:hypothetical protein n=1 Tax=Nonomuraea sp. NPDC049784 TaxID=3154361 RepID=UPI0033F64AB5
MPDASIADYAASKAALLSVSKFSLPTDVAVDHSVRNERRRPTSRTGLIRPGGGGSSCYA